MRDHSSARLAAAALALALAGPASAQATRTWVSGVGDDANPCSRTAPCKTFAGALSKTAAGGEIDALDPGDFGAVTIAKSIVIDGAHARGVISSTGQGIVVNAGPNDVVVLRRLRILGTSTSSAGVLFQAGAELHLESSVIAGFTTGVDFRPVAGGRLHGFDLEVRESGDVGISLGSSDVSAPALATLSRVRLTANGNYGILAGDNSRASLGEVVVTGSSQAGLAALPAAAGAAELNVDGAVLSGNAVGVEARAVAPGQALVRLSKVVALDATPSALAGANGQILSFGNNRLLGTVTDFELAVDPASVQVSAGAAATVMVSATSTAISPGAVTLSCTGLPAGARCSFSPASLSPSGSPATSTLTLTTDGSTATLAGLSGPVGPAGGAALAAWALLAMAGALTVLRRRSPALAGLAILGLLASCNGGGGGGGASPVRPGVYTIQVTGTSSLTTHQAALTLEVR